MTMDVAPGSQRVELQHREAPGSWGVACDRRGTDDPHLALDAALCGRLRADRAL
jgi:hypothetical protein